MHAEGKICTVGNLYDVATRTGKMRDENCETSRLDQHEKERETAEGEVTADERINHEINGTCHNGSEMRDVSQCARSDNTSTQGSCESCIL